MRTVILAFLVSTISYAGLRAGAGSSVITPPRGTPMAGYYSNRAAQGVHDDLLANALVLESGGVRAALVACDLIGLPVAVVDRTRALIEKQSGIPAANIMISATHAHTGPVLTDVALRYNLEGDMQRLAAEYSVALPGRIAESVKVAVSRLAPATAFSGMGHEDSVSFNRRFVMTDGTVGWNPGKLNPKIVKPAGPIDPELPVVYFEDELKTPLATYVNFALHLDTVGGLEFSADYPFTLRTMLGKLKGPQMLTLFTIGAAGNLNHIDVKTKAPQKGHSEAARIGSILAGEVLKTYARLAPVADGPLQASSRIVNLPLVSFKPEELSEAREITAKFGRPDAPAFLKQVHAAKVMDIAARNGQPIPAEVQIIALGRDVAWVGLPGEVFVELGMAIKKASPFRQTIVVELANGSPGYIPNSAAYSQGNYEVISSRFVEGAGEMLVDRAIELLKQAHSTR